ncbi:MAG: glycosyltransferase family 4 protein, partial [Mesorhizobium sp.]
NWLTTIHHGLPTELYKPVFETSPGEPYLAFLGRMSRDKRPDRAIEIALRSGLKLKLAAKIGDDDRAYFREM